ncbi:spore gernimation protein GerC [Clostridium carboxidivorans P7]|uniref:Germination protein, Ger(X)C family n=1 Tax=Clostridium carboxidivorans P7 TaxID=536227 RepID=C6PTH6_9CLOT|nr:Ger(x)C family spore germination protein [Clostridium carboxidivorans]AKN33718.1 spore gernimation protein GerC [Clostridium carboxidivorans P7]EET87499.1 germination protein, Ger(x)C family [Clostridium carboxidivorans P7]EFG86683.1 germination protein, Ger(X)C family [Clostridium carboxidivorans P7]
MKRMFIFILLVIVTISSTGCWDQKIYEESGFVMQVGFDPSSSNGILMSFVLPVFDVTARERTELIYADANLLREFREIARHTAAKVTEGGKIQQILISDSLAIKGIHDLFEVAEREASDPSTAFVVITEGSSKDLIEALQTVGDKPPTYAYIHDLIRNNIRLSYIPETRIFQFSTLYFSPGIDPVAPIIKLQHDKGKGIELTGSALFAGDKMVGKIDIKQTSLLLAMMGKMKKGEYISKIMPERESENGRRGCAISITKAKRKLTVDIKNDIPVVNIDLNFKTNIGEYKWNKMYGEKIEQSIEEALSKDIKDVCEKLLKYTQEVGSDPLGIGDIVRARHNSYWKNINWESVYRNIVFNVKVNIDVKNHGVIQ